MAQYLPVLLVSVSAVSTTNTAPDDSSLDTQAIGQVDYLSHDWQEEDVAKSWRNMTRRKDSIQNGARLENASWRTWWKQRNNLPTVSPETLNWLKDSDVTWLYGPLHTAADWAPPPRHSPEREGGRSSPNSLSPHHATLHPSDGLRSHSSRSNSPWALKPILKHRSISELLSISLPPSPGSDSMEIEDEHGYFSHAASNCNANSVSSRSKAPRELAEPDEARKRPKLTHTKSDTHIHQRNPFRRESPPLPLGSTGHAPTSLSPPARSPSMRSRENSCGDSSTTQKRHISFNTFVEQCIAIEKPNMTKDGFYGTLDEEDEDDVDVNEYKDGYPEDDDSDEEDESDDDVLEMRPSGRSRTSSSRRIPSLSGTSSASGWTSLDGLNPGSEREHVTIAPIAPTMLKTSTSSPAANSYIHGSYGSIWEEDEIEDEETLFAGGRQQNAPNERTDTVNLVYVPPQGSVYAERVGVATNGNVTGGGSKAFGFPLSSPPHAATDLRTASFDDVNLLAGRRHEDAEFNPAFDSGFDFIGGSDMGGVDDYSLYRSSSQRTGRSPAQPHCISGSDLQSTVASDTTIEQAEETQSAAHSKSSGSVSEEGTVILPSLPRPSSPKAGLLQSPHEVQPSSPIRAPAHTAAPKPSPAIPVPHHHKHTTQSPSPVPSSVSTGTTSSATSGGSASSYNSQLLEPSARGRSTSPITSASACGDSIRGRGSVRGGSNSVSDRDRRESDPPRGRSRSRSIGTGSPLDGSVSPRSGSRSRLGPGARRGSLDSVGGIGLGGYGTYGLGASPTWRDKSLSPEENEGIRKGVRSKTSRSKRSGGSGVDSSVSPPNTVRVKAVVDDADSPPRPSLPTTTETFENDIVHIEVVDASLSTNPTPSNSPTSAFKPLAPSSFPTSVAPSPNPTFITPTPSNTRGPTDDPGTLVGRAVDIVSSAKGYLGSFWGGGERQAQYTREGSGVSHAPVSR